MHTFKKDYSGPLTAIMILILVFSLVVPARSDIPWVHWRNSGNNFYESWTTINSVHFPSNTRGYMGGVDATGSKGALARFSSDTNLWADISSYLPSEFTTSYTSSEIDAVFFRSNTLGWIAGEGGAYGLVCRTSTGGESWDFCVQPPGATRILDIFFPSDSVGYAVGEPAGNVWKTTNGGSSWSTTGNGLATVVYHGIYCRSTTFCVVVGDGSMTEQIRRTTNGGTNWSLGSITIPPEIPSFYPGDLRKVFFTSDTEGWAVGLSGTNPAMGTVLHTTDGGGTWQQQATGIPDRDLFALYMRSSTEGWALGEDGAALLWTGTAWVDKSELSPTKTGTKIYGVSLFGSSDGFAVGETSPSAGILWRLLGTIPVSLSTIVQTSITTTQLTVTQTSTSFSPTITQASTSILTSVVTSTTSTSITQTSTSTSYVATSTQTSSVTTTKTFTESETRTSTQTSAVTSTITQTTTTFTTMPPVACPVAFVSANSELESHADFLRAFRNNQIMRTYAGQEFMKVFNAWYYAWAPFLARSAASSPALADTIRVVLYPLFGILYASYHAYTAIAPISAEAAAITAGLVAASLIGMVYVAPIAYLLIRVARKFSKRSIDPRLKRSYLAPIGAWIALSAMIIAFAYSGASPLIMGLGTASLVLSALASAAILGVNALASIKPFTSDLVALSIASRLGSIRNIRSRARQAA